eukprot:g2874.t1
MIGQVRVLGAEDGSGDGCDNGRLLLVLGGMHGSSTGSGTGSGKKTKHARFNKQARRSSMMGQSVLKEGYLEKESAGMLRKKWQSRYFELSGHYLKYYENKQTMSDKTIKGTIDVKDMSEVTAQKDGGIVIALSDGQSTIKLRHPSKTEDSAASWIDAIDEARTAAAEEARKKEAEAALMKKHGVGTIEEAKKKEAAEAHVEQVRKATKIVQWLVVTGKKEDAGQRRLMGEYKLVEGKWINGYGVWADKEGNGRYIHYASSTDEWWFSESKEDMEAGGWRVLVPTTEVGSSSSSSSASFVEAIELVIRGPGQYKGNHLLMGISKEGFVMALKVLKWHEYVRDNKDFDDGKGGCWNSGPKNGYDLARVLVPSYMKSKGKSHMSFVEAVLEGEIEELRPIRKEVGTTDAFFSQVQKTSIEEKVKSLEEAVERYADVLREDREGTREMRRAALVAFYEKHAPQYASQLIGFLDGHLDHKYKTNLAGFEEWINATLKGVGINVTPPNLASLRATKPADQNTHFFIDFLCLRQLMNDFNLARVLEAIKVIAITVIELAADWREAEAWLHRLFCVVEGFATVNAKGKLLVVGPALKNQKKVMEWLEVATDKTRCLEMMDCGDAEKTKCFFEADTKTIRKYIKSSVGFVKTDKQVLSGVASGCMDRVLSVMEKDKKQQERAAEMAHG